MISRIHLTNFQGHKSTDLILSPGINVITGQSDSGKSSVIRSLYWLVYNRPTGAAEAFKHWGADKKEPVAVMVELDGTNAVRRFRQGSENGYELTIEGQEGGVQKLKAIRQDVPAEVMAELDLDAHNLQVQHEGYFLLSDSPGDVARKLNEVCGLDIIDDCLKTAGLLISRNGQGIKVVESKIEKIKADQESYDDLEGREKALGKLERKQGHLDDAREKIDTLVDLIDRRGRLAEDLETVNDLLEAEAEADALMAKVEEQKKLKDRITELQDLLDERARLDKELSDTDVSLGELESGLHSLWDGLGVCPLCEQPAPRHS